MNKEQTELNEQQFYFTEKCPICGGKMAKGNLFCSKKCYREFKKK